jgi:hypothetical protein
MGVIKRAIIGMVWKNGLIKAPAESPKTQRSNSTTMTMTSKRPTPPPPIQIALPITGENNRVIYLGFVLDEKSFAIHFWFEAMRCAEALPWGVTRTG